MTDSNQASMKVVADTTKSLLLALAAAHRKWTLSHEPADPFTDQVAAYCAFQALANAFKIGELVTDPPSREKVEAFIAAMDITVGTENETPIPLDSKMALA